jgi:3-hydroxyacyl-[acyl-carrier-protein] dehydratase
MDKLIQSSIEKGILALIPQQKPFRFIDEILEVDENHIVGTYTFKKDEFFYEGHFPDMPVTPGVILTECMAQIGLVALAIYIVGADQEEAKKSITLFTSSYVDFKKMVMPGDKVIVRSKKQYFRFKKLSCEVVMENTAGELICSGTLSGMFVSPK